MGIQIIMKDILIVGGSGFVGTALRLNAPPDYNVECLSRKDTPSKANYDAIIHAAWDGDFVMDHRLHDMSLRMARRIQCPMLMLSSGAAQYPVDQYGKKKRYLEQLVLSNGGSVARLWSFIGPHLHRHTPYDFMWTGKRGEDLIITGSGSVARSYLYETEMAQRIWDVLWKKPGTYTVGSNKPVIIKQLAYKIANICNVDVKILKGPDGPRPLYVPTDGQIPKISLDESLELLSCSFN
jgi:nucleoside-diphosphate-sugar epimerase